MLVLKLPHFLPYREVREKARQFQNKHIFRRNESVLILSELWNAIFPGNRFSFFITAYSQGPNIEYIWSCKVLKSVCIFSICQCIMMSIHDKKTIRELLILAEKNIFAVSYFYMTELLYNP